MKTKMNIGLSSLILIFIVLCLVTFGLLSLSSARNSLALAERNAEAVKEYYRADQEGERFIAMVDEKLKKMALSAAGIKGPEDIQQAELKESLGDYYNSEDHVIRTDIPMARGQALRVELKPELDSRKNTWCSVSAFYVYNQEDYEIDKSMPVWTGQ